jgi:hypothetical protein
MEGWTANVQAACHDGGMKNTKEKQNDNTRNADLAWWKSLSSGEKNLIWSLMEMLRAAKRSQRRDVARAGAEWERGIGCFIKLRLMNGYSATGNQHFKRKHVFITVEPAGGQGN